MDIDGQKLDALTAAMLKLADSVDSLQDHMVRAATEQKQQEKSANEQDAIGRLDQKILETPDTQILRDIRDAVQQLNAKVTGTTLQ